MRLTSAKRIANGRCARPEETLVRLEAGLTAVCSFEYRETRVAEGLYRGALLVDMLDFPPMGKGASPLLCKISTLAEAAEWLALRRRRELPGHVRAHQRDVPAALAIEDLLSHIASLTPEMLERIKDVEPARHWVDGHSLMRDCRVGVPLEYVNAISGTNGVAAGNRIEEAIAQAAFEVFERRAVITVVKNRMEVPTIAIDSIEHPVLCGQIAALRERGTEMVVKDLSFGGVLPCVGVYFVNRGVAGDLQAHHALKAAASFDREAALMNCLTEYAQICEQEAGDDDAGAYRQLVCRDDTDNCLPLFWFGYVPFAEAGFLKEGEAVPFDEGEALADCLEDIERIRGICAQLGKDCVVVDLTDPAVGFPVVQAVIPGYSDILPYHPASSPVLFKGWTRDLSMGECRTVDGLQPCTAAGLFPGW